MLNEYRDEKDIRCTYNSDFSDAQKFCRFLFFSVCGSCVNCLT